MPMLALADPDQILQSLSNDLMSPYCPGRTISSCPSPQARQLEDEILAAAKAGKSREEIEQALVQEFGSEIVGYAPPPVLLYGSALVGLVALVMLVMMGRRWARRPAMAAAGGASVGAGVGASVGTAAAARSEGAPSRAELDRLEDALDEVDDF